MAEQGPTGTPGSTDPAAATTPAAAGTAQVDLNAMLAENKRLADERATLAKQYGELRKGFTQKAQEAAEYRRRLEAAAAQTPEYDFGDPNPPARTAAPSIDPKRLEDIEANQAIINFKLDHSDWNEGVEKDKDGRSLKTMWQAINELLDETNPVSQTLAGATPYLTLKNAYREVRLQQFQKAQSEGAAATAASADQRALMRARAATSGQTAGEGQEVLDVSKMTPQQMIDAGLVDIDPRNPPSHARTAFKTG